MRLTAFGPQLAGFEGRGLLQSMARWPLEVEHGGSVAVAVRRTWTPRRGRRAASATRPAPGICKRLRPVCLASLAGTHPVLDLSDRLEARQRVEGVNRPSLRRSVVGSVDGHVVSQIAAQPSASRCGAAFDATRRFRDRSAQQCSVVLAEPRPSSPTTNSTNPRRIGCAPQWIRTTDLQRRRPARSELIFRRKRDFESALSSSCPLATLSGVRGMAKLANVRIAQQDARRDAAHCVRADRRRRTAASTANSSRIAQHLQGSAGRACRRQVRVQFRRRIRCCGTSQRRGLAR